MTKPRFIVSPEQIIDGDFYALPHEAARLEFELAKLKHDQAIVAEHISDAMEQSSETWHDNAPAEAVFGEMNLLDQKGADLARAKRKLHVVEYPDPDFNLITIGTRVGCQLVGEHFLMDITGNVPVSLEPEEHVEMGSIAAPMPVALLGKVVGDLVEISVGDRDIAITVTDIDQVGQRAFYET